MWRLVKITCFGFLVLLLAQDLIASAEISNLAKAPQPSSCVEIMKNATNKPGVYQLHIPGSKLSPFDVYCEGAGWTLIQRRQTGQENFFRNWRDYKRGFGNLYGEHWLGLDLINAMTRHRPHKLQIIMRDFDRQSAWAYYDKIYVASEIDNYRLTIGKFQGNVGDGMTHHNNSQFSTFDRVNTLNFNCAVELLGGFWYNSCATANLNGQYYQYSNRETFPAMTWDYWQRESLQYVHMAIRALD